MYNSDFMRESAEGELRRSEERYRAFIHQSTEGIYRFELRVPISIALSAEEQIDFLYKHAVLAECNDAMARMYGYEVADEIIGIRLDKLLLRSDPNNTEFLRAFIHAGYRLADAESHEVDLAGKDKFFLNNLNGPVEERRLTQIWGTQRDITERKQAERALQESNRRLQFLSRTASELLASNDPVDLLDRLYQQLATLEGLDFYLHFAVDVHRDHVELVAHRGISREVAEQVREMDFSEVVHPSMPFPKTHPSGALKRQWRETKAELIRRLGIKTYLCHPLIANDEIVGLLSFGSFSREKFDPPTVSLIRTVCDQVAEAVRRKRVQDALRESEERQRMAMEFAEVGMWFWHIPKNKLEWSPVCKRLFGLTPDESASYEKFLEIVHPEDRERVSYNNAKMRRASSVYTSEFRVIWPDGSVRWLHASGKSRLSSEGEPEEMMGVVVDITARKTNEMALEVAQAHLQTHADELEGIVNTRTAELNETVAELESFSYTVSHDLRAPIRAMRGFSKILMEEHALALDTEARNMLRQIERAAERMDRLTRELLHYTRVVRSDFKCEPVNLDEVLDDVLHLNPALEPATILVEKPLPTVLGERTLLAQCLSNLLNNAVKFARPGVPPHVTVSTERHDDCVRIIVQDNGIGIDPRYLGKLFQPFQRLDSSASEGTGMGLAIVAKAVQRMGGSVGVSSERGQGSRFWINLPVAEAGTPKDDNGFSPDKK